jgi:hypothetical protein
MPSISLWDAWQSGIITEEQYNTLLANGAFPNTVWTPGALDLPTTSSAMTVVKTIGLVGTKRQSVVVRNTGDTNSLNVLIEFYVDDVLAAKFEDTVGPDNEPYWLDMEYAFTTAVISVKDTIAGSHTTYEIGVVVI